MSVRVIVVSCETHHGRKSAIPDLMALSGSISSGLAILLILLMALPAWAQFQETIDVERIVVDAHVIDSRGNPLTGLTVADFRVRVTGKEAEIESVEWIDITKPYAEGLTPEEAEASFSTPAPQGRLIIVFFQTDFARMRIKGQLRMTGHAIEFLDTLLPYDRVALVSFDSHLKLWQDFTSDRSLLERALKDAMEIREPGSPQLVHAPALFTRIDRRAAQQTTSSEQALLLVGNALLPIPGPKSLILFGWGLGTYSRAGVTMTRDYVPARRALESSRTSVFSLDISDADYHSLEVGLGKASADTGGFYEKTHIFPRFAMEKLQRTISGHYVLVVKRPAALPRGEHTIETKLVKRRGQVLARGSFVDK